MCNNVCMNCHAVVKGDDEEAKQEIGKIWKSFGLDIETDEFVWDSVSSYDQTPITIHWLINYLRVDNH